MYAAGTRTVRGLEALTLSIPPLPGESIVKRPGNENMFSIGSIFKSKGYTTQFMYGGYGYFDNMNYFFGNNGYQVIDRTALQPGQIHYANIWGVADEDLFTLAIKTLDSDYQAGKPFFTHIMTVSNHRPYTYPDGRIDIPPSSQTRNGAVKYTDYAIGKFIKEAAAKPWFANTVCVIVADHCASSAGKEELPVAGYHIPLIMYSPANIPPQRVDALTSQIDVPPTILGLLHFNYTTKFYGHDIFKTPAAQRRVFISTYQGLGYLQSDTLIVQTPVKKIKAYKIDPVTSAATEIDLPKALSDEAISFYQSAAWLIQQKKYNALHQ
jgi:phosphoglycerol transferase MdoB-like AlkP superfamily enzyme